MGYVEPSSIKTPNKIQRRDIPSIRGDSDGFRCDKGGSFVINDDDRYVPILNEDDGKRNLDNNWFDNEWNASNRFLFVSNSLHVKSDPTGSLLRLKLFLPSTDHLSDFVEGN